MQKHKHSSPSVAGATATAGAGRKEEPENANWTEEAEERLLKAALEIAREPVESFDATVSPVERVRRAVGGEFTAKEIVGKIKQLRKRYEEICRRKDSDAFGRVFEISDQIWGKLGKDKEKEKERKGS